MCSPVILGGHGANFELGMVSRTWCMEKGMVSGLLVEAFVLTEGSCHCKLSVRCLAMSRCFPFPPPGYENKAKTDNIDILTKEKHNGKNHKKEKKEKRKREGKEKEIKRSKENDGEKKDRKEKPKDNNARDKNKGQNKNLDEKKNQVQPEYHNGTSKLHFAATKDNNFALELDCRIRDEDKATGSQMAQKVTVTDKRRHELSGTMVETNQMGNKFNDGQRTKVEETGLQNSIPQNYPRMRNQRFDGMARPLEKNSVQNQMDKEANTKLKEGGSRNDKHNDQDGEKKSKSKDRYGEKAKRKEEKAKRKAERAKRKEEKAKRKEEKEKKKEEKANRKKGKVNEQKEELNNQQAKLEESSQDSIITCSNIPAQSLKEIRKDFVGEKISTKRKGLEINLLLDDNEIRPNKLRRPMSSSDPVVENGRNNEPCQTAIELQSIWRKADAMADNGGQRTNGFIKAQLPVVCSTSSTSVSDDNSGQSAKPPHPDSMYLNEILSIPQIKEPPVFEDHGWLFSSSNLQSNVSQVDATGNDRMVEVWAESLQIVVADINALPYVLPY